MKALCLRIAVLALFATPLGILAPATPVGPGAALAAEEEPVEPWCELEIDSRGDYHCHNPGIDCHV